ncbi:MAG: molybdate ABC transporter substrate-binding protein [Porphyrobacter sp.]|nr:molybdate ABC transporter substrate-binding protein [Porphyrobacter sp.]
MVPARSLFAALAAGALALLPACSGGAEHREDGDEAGPVVLAAASLHEALTEVAGAWAAKGHQRPRLSFAASSVLARQIEGGAPADLFVSADAEWMDRLDRAGLLRPGSRADLLGNQLVLIAPASAAPAAPAAGVRPPAGLAALSARLVAMGDPEAVPAGRYARAALEHLGLWTAVAPRVVPAENVRAALALVERGEVPLGIVYATDARASPRVVVIHRFAPASHPPIRYPVAILAAARHPDAAGLRAFLASPPAARIFVRHGFAPLADPALSDAAAPAL